MSFFNAPRFLPIVVIAILGVIGLRFASEFEKIPTLSHVAKAFAADPKAKETKPAAGVKSAEKKDAQASKNTSESKKAPNDKIDPTEQSSMAPDSLERALAAADMAAPAAAIALPQAPVCTTSVDELAKRAGISRNEIDILQALGKRREQLDARERGTKEKEALIATAEAKLQGRITQLDDLKKQIETLLQSANKTGDADVARLTKVYENMKPKDAAAVLSTLSDDVRLPIVAQMKDRALASVLAAMPADKARDLTEKLAKRMSKAEEIKQKLDKITTPGQRANGLAQAPNQPKTEQKPS